MTKEVLSLAQLFSQRLDLLLVLLILTGLYFLGKKALIIFGQLVKDNLNSIDSNLQSLSDAVHALREELSVLNKNLAIDEQKISQLENRVERLEDKIER